MAEMLFMLSGLAAVAYYIYSTWDLLFLKLEVGTNSDSFASDVFISLVNDACHEMVVRDDGNRMRGSVYEDEHVIDAVRKKLESSPNFRMRCLFSCEDETAFKRAFKNEKGRVLIRVAQPRHDIHFKIIDGGRQGYISTHAQGQSRRSYRLYRGWLRKRTQWEVFGRHLADIDRAFQHAA